MNVESLQEEFAMEQRALDWLTGEVSRLDAIFIEQRALSDECEVSFNKAQHMAASMSALRERDAMAKQRHKQEGVVAAIRNRIEDERLQRISNLEMFDRLQRQTAEIVPFPATNDAPEAA